MTRVVTILILLLTASNEVGEPVQEQGPARLYVQARRRTTPWS